MPKIIYTEKNFGAAAMADIDQANAIIEEYRAEGFILTVRQLYYQFVARDLIPNTQRSYKRLGKLVSDGRLAGLIDWDAIEDRTRNLVTPPRWTDPGEIIDSCARQFRVDKWVGQEYRPEVWIEKEALAGVFDRICTKLDVPFFACKGYNSISEMWSAAQRLIEIAKDHGQKPMILHFGDHDPSGMDMSRDIVDRLNTFGLWPIQFFRLALNMDQVEKLKLPANPAKVTDSRAKAYIAEFGTDSWELDALDPKMLADLVQTAVMNLTDIPMWNKRVKLEKQYRERLADLAENWEGGS